MALHVLGDLRHTCMGCGGSCMGVEVAPVDDAEEARITHFAALLGVDEPFDRGNLRQEGGACVFLGDDTRCMIQATFGAEAKPAFCSQYPLVAVRADEGVRVAIDPGCYTHWQSWKTGPPPPEGHLHISTATIPDQEKEAESRLLNLASTDDASVGAMLRILMGMPPTSHDLPPGFGGRLVTLLQSMNTAIFTTPVMGRVWHGALAPLGTAIPTWSSDAAPAWELPAETEEYAIDVLQRMLFVRQVETVGSVAGTALLTLAGAVACGWASPELKDFGPAMAAWTRALRSKPFLAAMLPDRASLERLVGG